MPDFLKIAHPQFAVVYLPFTAIPNNGVPVSVLLFSNYRHDSYLPFTSSFRALLLTALHPVLDFRCVTILGGRVVEGAQETQQHLRLS